MEPPSQLLWVPYPELGHDIEQAKAHIDQHDVLDQIAIADVLADKFLISTFASSIFPPLGAISSRTSGLAPMPACK
jgi:hypothetical protein